MPDNGHNPITLVKATNISLRWGGNEVLQNVSLSVNAGEIVSLIGPNGGGKTSLLRVLLGLTPPYRGSILTRSSIRIGYMPQRLFVDEVLPLTVGRFLTLGSNADRVNILAILDEGGAGARADIPLQNIAGGEVQRVLLARALQRNPDLLVLDEPVQGVDINGQSELFTRIERIRDERGCGVLLVSHDLHLVMRATDRVVCLNHHVCCTGQPESVSQHPEYIALFGVNTRPGFAFYSHDHDHLHDATTRPTIPASRDDKLKSFHHG